MPNPVVHFEIGGSDGERSQKYYADLFDWEVNVVEDMGNYGLVSQPEEGPGIGGGIFQTPDDAPPYLTVYVAVDDVAATLNKAVELGGSKVMEPMPVPTVGTVAIFLDPDGNTVGIIQPEPQ